MIRIPPTAALLALALAFTAAAPAWAQKAPPAKSPPAENPRAASADPRAYLRGQVEDELALLRPRLKLAEAEAKEQAERYSEMAASKAEAGKKAAEKAEKDRARTDAARARQGYKPKAAADAAKPAGEAGGAGAAAPKKVDPVLTQHYLVMSLRDQVRQLRERIAYLEELRAKLGAKS